MKKRKKLTFTNKEQLPVYFNFYEKATDFVRTTRVLNDKNDLLLIPGYAYKILEYPKNKIK